MAAHHEDAHLDRGVQLKSSQSGQDAVHSCFRSETSLRCLGLEGILASCYDVQVVDAWRY